MLLYLLVSDRSITVFSISSETSRVVSLLPMKNASLLSASRVRVALPSIAAFTSVPLMLIETSSPEIVSVALTVTLAFLLP